MPSFSEILSKQTIFRDRNVLSPHFIPEALLFREKEISQIMSAVSPALLGGRPKNLFIYGKTGTGKTSSVKHVMDKFKEQPGATPACYVNCRMYNSRYRVLQAVAKSFLADIDRGGFGVSFLYEKLMEWLETGKRRLIIVLDEVDMVKDLDELIYTLTRANDELTAASVTIIGITNKLSFKDALDPRTKSSLCESGLFFNSYTATQLQGILRQRADMGFAPNSVDNSAINLASALTAQETGDARYALKLLTMAGEAVDAKGAKLMTDKDVETARRNVDESIAIDAVSTLPEHQQLVLFGVASLTLAGSRYAKLAAGVGEEDHHFLLSGEVYEEYSRACRLFKRKKRSARWYREYLNDLEMLGLITTVESGKGVRGHTRLIKIGYPADEIKRIIEKNMSIVSSSPDDEADDLSALNASVVPEQG